MVELVWEVIVKQGGPLFAPDAPDGPLGIKNEDAGDFGIWASDFHAMAPEQTLRVYADVEVTGGDGVADVVVVWRKQVWDAVLGEYRHVYAGQVQAGEEGGGGVDDQGGVLSVEGEFEPPVDVSHFRVLCQFYQGTGRARFLDVTAVVVDPYVAPAPVEPVATEVVRVYQPAGRGLPVLEVVDVETGEVIVAPPVGGDGLPGGGVWVTLGDGEKVLVEGGLEVVG